MEVVVQPIKSDDLPSRLLNLARILLERERMIQSQAIEEMTNGASASNTHADLTQITVRGGDRDSL